MDLTNEQWRRIQPLVPPMRRKPGGRGRPPREPREVLNGILWILRTGAPWKDLPERYPPYQTCHRRFQQWTRAGVFAKMLGVLAEDLEQRGKLDFSEAFIDGSFSGAKKGGSQSGTPNAVRVARSWRSQTAMVFLSPQSWPALRRTR
jgi:transposase